MDFKNFVDILSTPKNIGSNKWVLNNFSDLKSSNDYLHIIRLRYDNRWLKAYWDGKLKEVEKESNFYVSTPIKNKLFNNSVVGNSGVTNPLNLNLINSGVFKNFNINYGLKDFKGLMVRSSNKRVEGGEIKNNFLSNPAYLYSYSLKNSLLLDTNFLEYRLLKNFYNKNSKFSLKDLEGVNSGENF